MSISTCTSTTTLLHETNSSGADVSPANNHLEITVAPGSYVTDVATVTDGATGNVDFRYYHGATAALGLAACTADTTGTGGTEVGSGPVTLSGGTPNTATSAPQQFNAVGDYYWRAFYIPGNLSASRSDCNEIVHVVKQPTAISTSPFYYPNDSATVKATSGGGTPAGTVRFRLYDTQANCNTGTTTGLLGSIDRPRPCPRAHRSRSAPRTRPLR